MFDFLSYSFMLRALVAGSAVALVLGWIGTFIVTRKMSFIGDGLAHASLAGVALAILVGVAPLPTAVVVAVLLAILIYFLEKKTNISSDMAIAVIFTTGMALGLIMLHYYQGYQPELMSYLFGNILAISQFDFYFIIAASVAVLAILVIFHKYFLFATFDPIGAHLAGNKPWLYDLMLYIISAIAIISSIKLVGIILVSALLVVPSAISRLFSTSYTQFIFIASLMSIVIMITGLIASYYLDWPSGATIVLTGTTLFLLTGVFKKLVV